MNKVVHMKLKLPLLLVLVCVLVLRPQRAHKALAHTGCDSWWWTDDENQLHQIVNPSIPSNLNEPPAHIGLYPSGDSACYHMNRTTWC